MQKLEKYINKQSLTQFSKAVKGVFFTTGMVKKKKKTFFKFLTEDKHIRAHSRQGATCLIKYDHTFPGMCSWANILTCQMVQLWGSFLLPCSMERAMCKLCPSGRKRTAHTAALPVTAIVVPEWSSQELQRWAPLTQQVFITQWLSTTRTYDGVPHSPGTIQGPCGY